MPAIRVQKIRPIRWARRVEPGKVRRLYRLGALGLWPDLIEEVGWGLYARARDVLTVHRAVLRGEVPCPHCGGMVYRRKHEELAKRRRPVAPDTFRCPHCGQELTWQACREALRQAPKCFDCLRPLTWRYSQNRLICPRCGREWSWQRYRRSVSARVRLPCPHCGKLVRRPERSTTGPAAPAVSHVPCPRCGAQAVHAAGRLYCPRCGYRTAWARYRKRMKRRTERLRCSACGQEFTWRAWRELYKGQHLLSGNPAALGRFIANWPACQTPQERMIEIDRLLHAVHGRGALGPLLIEGDEASVRALLDEIAGR